VAVIAGARVASAEPPRHPALKLEPPQARDATVHPPVPALFLARLNAICLGLAEAYEETAWTGVRWMATKKNFAHALRIENGLPPAFAEVAGAAGPAMVVTCRLPVQRLPAPRFRRAPCFRPVWFANAVVDTDSDWDEIAELIVASYCVLAPRKLAQLVDAFAK